MEQRGFKCIIAVMLMFSVVKPALATVIYANTLPKNSISVEWPKFINNLIGLTITSTLGVNDLSVAFVNKVFDDPFSSPNLATFQASLLLSPELTGVDTIDSDNQLAADCIEPADALRSTSNDCDDLLYEKVSFTNTCQYFEAPVHRLDTLSFRFWNSITNHADWDIMLDKDIAPPVEPEPTPVGLLGAGIIGLASLQQRNKNKPA